MKRWQVAYTTDARETYVAPEIWDRAASGDNWAIADLYRRYGPALVAYAAARSVDDPEDIANMAFYDGIKALPSLRRRCEPVFRAYIYRAVRSRIAGEQRRSKLDTVPLVDEIAKDPTRSVAPIDERLAADSGFEQLLDQVTPAQREVLAHRFLAGYSVIETATRLNRSPDSVRQLQRRGIIRLRTLAAFAVALVVGVAVFVLVQDDSGVVTDLPTEQPQVDSAPEQVESAPDGDVLQVEVGDGNETGTNPSTLATTPTTLETTTSSTTAEEEGTTLCLDLDGEIGHHSLLVLGTCRASVSQQVTFLPGDGSGFAQVRIGDQPDNCLHVRFNSSEGGAPVELNVCGREGDNAKWKLDDGRLVSLSADKCLTARNGNSEPGTNLVLGPCGDTDYQRFTVETIATEEDDAQQTQIRLVS